MEAFPKQKQRSPHSRTVYFNSSTDLLYFLFYFYFCLCFYFHLPTLCKNYTQMQEKGSIVQVYFEKTIEKAKVM